MLQSRVDFQVTTHISFLSSVVTPRQIRLVLTMSAVPSLTEDVPRPSAEHPNVGIQQVEDGGKPPEMQSETYTNGVRDAPWQLHDTPIENQRPMKVIVIGAGYSGVYCGIRIPERLRNCELTIYEKNEGIGGTWSVLV